MGSLDGDTEGGRRPRFLCLHGFRTSAEIMRKQVLGKWPADITARLDLVFADAPFPTKGKSDVEDIFDPPYYEWFQFDKDPVEVGELMLEHLRAYDGKDPRQADPDGERVAIDAYAAEERDLAELGVNAVREPAAEHTVLLQGALHHEAEEPITRGQVVPVQQKPEDRQAYPHRHLRPDLRHLLREAMDRAIEVNNTLLLCIQRSPRSSMDPTGESKIICIISSVIRS